MSITDLEPAQTQEPWSHHDRPSTAHARCLDPRHPLLVLRGPLAGACPPRRARRRLPFDPPVATLAGHMVAGARVYAVGGAWLPHAIGRGFIRLNFDQHGREADYPFNLVRVREKVEGAALYAREADEGRTF